jgi:hypothetical protein
LGNNVRGSSLPLVDMGFAAPKIGKGSSTGLGLSGKGDFVTIRLDTRDVTRQLRSETRIAGLSYQAMKAAHTRLGNAVAKQALIYLEDRLINARRRVNDANAGRRRGLRASLKDPRNVVVDPYGRYWGVGNPKIFNMYGALDYYRVIERGGGFQGRIWGLLIDEEGKLTTGPGEMSMSERRSMMKDANSNAAALNRHIAGGGTRHDLKGSALLRDYMENRNTARSGLTRFGMQSSGKLGKAVIYRTGQPRSDWKKWSGAAAAGIVTGKKSGWWFVVRNRVRAKRFLEDAMIDVMESDLPQQIYNEEFRAAGIPFRYIKGNVVHGAL